MYHYIIIKTGITSNEISVILPHIVSQIFISIYWLKKDSKVFLGLRNCKTIVVLIWGRPGTDSCGVCGQGRKSKLEITEERCSIGY